MTSRVQLALNVTDLEAATSRYRDLFGVEPAKTRPGYVNFAIDDPPLKLVLFENPGAAAPLNHLGVELASTDDVLAAGDRFAASGLAHTVARDDRCCHAVQDKVWVDVPDVPLGGWEFYTVLADDSSAGVGEGGIEGGCCVGGVAAEVRCCGAPSATGDA
jgi:catechol 2,3-dioxygenase-like lactoylglutathione lyase family enzyme